MPSELSITVKNEEKRQTTKHLIYDVYKEFNATPDKVQVKITMEVQ